MSKYRYEMGGIIRDTEIDFPYYTDEIIELLDEKDQRIAELEEQLKNSIKPKFKKGQIVYSPLDFQDIYKGQIDVFDYYTQKYWVFFGDDIGCEWCCESELFKTKKEAQERLKNYEKL